MNRSFASIAFLFFLLLGSACSKSSDNNTTILPGDGNPPVVVTDTTPKSTYDITLLDECTLFSTTPQTDTMERQNYNELSGIAASRINPGLLYVHEDDAGNNSILLTNAGGQDLGRIVLDNVSTKDMEDIAVGPGPDAAKSYIYLADIGDNNAGHTTVIIYRLPEPVLGNLSGETALHIAAADRIELAYPGSPVNAETLLLDPATKDLYIATKETSKSTLYVAPYPQSVSSVTPLQPAVRTNFDLLTSGDISPDGTEILLRNRSQVWYWKREAGQSLVKTILSKPLTAPYAGNEHQGEGICFAADAGGYFTDTETRDYPGAKSTISFYTRK